GALAQLFTQLSLTFQIRNFSFWAELAGGIDGQVFYRGYFEAVFIDAIGNAEVGKAAIAPDIPGHAVASASFSERCGTVAGRWRRRGGVDDIGVCGTWCSIAADAVIGAQDCRGRRRADAGNA